MRANSLPVLPDGETGIPDQIPPPDRGPLLQPAGRAVT